MYFKNIFILIKSKLVHSMQEVLNSFQIRTARAALRLTIDELSKLTRISKSTLIRIEKTENFDTPQCHSANLRALQVFFKASGIEFISPQAIYLKNSAEKNTHG